MDGEGRAFQDYYRMALENVSRIEAQKLLTTLKRESMAFARGLRWQTEGGWTGREGGREEGWGRTEGVDSAVRVPTRQASGCPLSLTCGPSFSPSLPPSLPPFP